MKASKAKSGILKRICALVLCTAILIGIMPEISFNKAEAVNTTQSKALNKLVQWGVMRGDQSGNLSPERAITRAEFVTMVNRAFGYTKTGAQPFNDVELKDWFYDDISIAYNIGYLSGTSKTTASPNANLTREAAVVMLCRNIMLKEQSGEDLSFTDSRTASSWSRGFIKAAAEKGIVSGDPSGTFRPLANITRGEVAILLSRIIGTPVKDKGTYSNNVSGNVMVSTSGVTLDNMIITGDLYITAGVGLGYVTLNNVYVYGQIIVSGAGESNKGDCSIIIKNSFASEMIVDNLANQYVTVRTMGSTIIDKTSVQTNAYLEDKCDSDYGMLYIEVNGETGTQLDLSGNIKEVVTITPESEINVGSGTVEKMTIDEAATDSTVNISQGAVVEILNLDTATTVTGKGDIESLYVNAPGCKVEMLPDYIYIRPGITANINGIEMDSTLAQQMSDKPRILTGYPRSDDIGPNQIITKFQTNKSGTIYWAIRLSGDGAMIADDIIAPPSYGAKVVKNGNINVNDANTTVEVKTTGLQIDTSYVLSAVFVDSKGDKSPVKTLYFTTPDNSKPAFTSGYPKASTIEDTYVVFDVATNKNCTLYWAIYKKGMTAPTANDFKDNSLSGAIDSGTLKMIKNEDDSILMGDVLEDARNALEELTDYDVYFFLTDSVNDSAIIKVSITTADRTPPEFLTNYPRITKIAATSLTGEGAINEDGKIYWALVKRGTEYPIVNPSLNNPDDILLDQKLQIKGGMYSLKSGSVTAKEDLATNINFSGLEAEGAYDIYFVAEDNHGNLSDIKIIENAKTLDSTAPEWIEQVFSQTNDEGKPLADTDVTIVFSEDIYHSRTRVSLLELYESSEDSFTLYGSDETITFEDIINQMFTFKNLDITDPNNQILHINVGEDKENISVELNEDGQTEVTFTSEALGLQSGATYQFILNYISDASNNNMPRNTEVDEFKTLDAQINLSDPAIVEIDVSGSPVDVDATFSAIPFANSTANASESSYYDILIGSDTTISFELYCRNLDEGLNWKQVTNKDGTTEFELYHTSDTDEWTALNLNGILGLERNQYEQVIKFPEKGFDFAIKLISINEEENSSKWNTTVNLSIFCVAGSQNNLYALAPNGTVSQTNWNDRLSKGEVSCISNPTNYTIEIPKYSNSAPYFAAQYPQAEPGDSITKINYALDREGKLYYLVAPAFDKDDNPLNKLNPTYSGTKPTEAEMDIGNGNLTSTLPEAERNHGLSAPLASWITNPSAYQPSGGYRSGNFSYPGGNVVDTFEITDLDPNTTYYIYFVLEGLYGGLSPVMVYKFKTGDVVSPVLNSGAAGSTANYEVSVNTNKDQSYVDAEVYWTLFPQTKDGYPEQYDRTIFDYITKNIDEYTDLNNNKPDILNFIIEKAGLTDDTSSTDNTPPLTAEEKAEIYTIRDAIYDGKFDVLASSELKNEIYDLISKPVNGYPNPSQQGSHTKPNDTVSATTGNPFRENIINPEELEAGISYIVFITAKNVLGGDPVFNIVVGIHKEDSTAPLVTSIDTPSDDTPVTTATYSGTITVNFDKTLYVKENEQSEDVELYTINTNDISSNVKTAVSFANVGDSGTRLQIKFDNCKTNTFVYITPSLPDGKKGIFCSEDGYGRTDNFALKLVKTSEVDNDDNPIWKVVMNSGDFVGSTSETNPDNE